MLLKMLRNRRKDREFAGVESAQVLIYEKQTTSIATSSKSSDDKVSQTNDLGKTESRLLNHRRGLSLYRWFESNPLRSALSPKSYTEYPMTFILLLRIPGDDF